MNLTDADVLKFQMGSPILLDDICAIYCATLREIVSVGYDKFHSYLGVMTATKPTPSEIKNPQIEEIIKDLSDFEYIVLMCVTDPLTMEAFRGACRLFLHENQILFSLDPAQIIIGPPEDKHILTEGKFYELQNVLRRMYFLEVEGEEIIIYDDDPPAVKRLKMQMRANREKVRRAKAKKAAQEKSSLAFSDLIGSLTLANCGLNMLNIWDITYYAFHDQLKRMGWRDQFNINNQAALAGAKLKKSQLKHWMRSIADSDKS